jgi:hypothetical protein
MCQAFENERSLFAIFERSGDVQLNRKKLLRSTHFKRQLAGVRRLSEQKKQP